MLLCRPRVLTSLNNDLCQMAILTAFMADNKNRFLRFGVLYLNRLQEGKCIKPK